MLKRNFLLFIVSVAIITSGVVLVLLSQTRDDNNTPAPPTPTNTTPSSTPTSAPVQIVTSTQPDCSQPFSIPAPVDLSLVTGILYPGQIRGTDYKPHGSFRFDNRTDNNIEVRAVMDGYIVKASRYQDEKGELQHSLFYANECGIMILNGHLLQIGPELQEVFDRIPLNGPGDSRTTLIEPRVYLKKGDVIATKVGYENFPGAANGRNVFFDFGLYDTTKTNGVNYDSAFRSKHSNINEYGVHALCWFDYLPSADEQLVRSLPAGGVEGKTSDYCK